MIIYEKMNKKDIFLIFLLLFLIFISILYSYNNFYTNRNFIIEAELPCDPKTHSCFIGDCENTNLECNESEIYYFYLIKKKSSTKIPLKECLGGELCELKYCTKSNVEEFSNYTECSK